MPETNPFLQAAESAVGPVASDAGDNPFIAAARKATATPKGPNPFLDAASASFGGGDYGKMADAAADRHGIDRGLFRAQIQQESGFNPRAVSSAGAKGLGQLMDGTGRGLGVTDPFDPEQNLNAAAKYYRSLLDRFHGNVRLALAAYNAGEGNVHKFGGVPPFKETQAYVAKLAPLLGGRDPYGRDPADTGERIVRDAPQAQYTPAQVQAGGDFARTLGLAPQPTAPQAPTKPQTVMDVVKRSQPKPTPTVWNGQKWANDPFQDLPFDQDEFQKGVDDPSQGVRLRNGGFVSFAQAAQAVAKHTGVSAFQNSEENTMRGRKSDTAKLESQIAASDAQRAQNHPLGRAIEAMRSGDPNAARTAIMGGLASSGANQVYKGVGGVANAFTGGSVGHAIDHATDKDGNPLSQDQKGDLLAMFGQLSAAAVSGAAAVGGAAVGGKALEALGHGIGHADLGLMATQSGSQALDATLPDDQRKAALAQTVLLGLMANGHSVLAAIKGGKNAILEGIAKIQSATSPDEAVKRAMAQYNLPEPAAQNVVANIAKHSEVDWAKSQADVANSPRNSGKVKPIEGPGVKPKQAPVVEAPPEAAPVKTAAADPVPDPLKTTDPVPAIAKADPVVAKPGDPNVTGLTVAQRAEEADRLGTAKPEPVAQVGNAEAHALGKADVESGKVDPLQLVKKLADDERGAKPQEYGALLEGRRRLLQDINLKAKAVDAALGTDAHPQALADYEAAKARAAEFDGHLDRVKGASGGSLQSLKIGTTLDEGDFAQVVAEKTRAKGSPISPAEEAKTKAITDQLAAKDARIAELEANQAKTRAQRTLVEGKSKAPQTLEQIQARRAAALQKASEAWKQAGKELQSQSNALLPGVATGYKLAKIAPHVLEIAKTVADEGALKLSDAVSRIRGHLKDVGVDMSEEDVHSILANTYERPPSEPKSRTAAEQQLQAWQSEIKGTQKAAKSAQMEADRAEKAELDRRTREALRSDRAKTAAEAKELRDRARTEARAATKAKRDVAEKTLGETSRLQKSIEDLKARLESGDLSTKPKPERDPELERQYYERDKLRQEVRRQIEAQKPRTFAQKAMTVAKDVGNIPRALKTTFDLSAPLRQGLALSTAHPGVAAKAFAEQLRAFKSAPYAHAANEELIHGEKASLYKKAGLYLSDPESGSFGQREEEFLSRWVGKIPLVGGSERAYTAYLNTLRAGVFDKMTAGGLPPDDLKAIANFINVASGRGPLGKGFEQSAAGLAQILFSPRYLTSRFALPFTPLYGGGSIKARAMIAGDLAKFAGTVFTFVKLSEAAGAQVSWDPTSSDFMKIKLGDTRIDALGGMQGAITFTNRMLQGRKVTAAGNEQDLSAGGFGKPTRLKVAEDFARGKLTPTAGYVANAMDGGKNVIGQKQDAADTAKDFFTPLIANDFYESIQAQGVPKGIALGILSGLGLSVSTQPPKGQSPPHMFDALASAIGKKG